MDANRVKTVETFKSRGKNHSIECSEERSDFFRARLVFEVGEVQRRLPCQRLDLQINQLKDFTFYGEGWVRDRRFSPGGEKLIQDRPFKPRLHPMLLLVGANF